MIPNTAQRVLENTAEHVNDEIELRTAQSIASCAVLGREAIERRLVELDREWDIERVLELSASIAVLFTLFLGATGSSLWFLATAVVALFLLQHSVQGWCPPLPLFRRLKIRTTTEIDYERYALKALRGDFRHVPLAMENRDTSAAEHAFDAVTS